MALPDLQHLKKSLLADYTQLHIERSSTQSVDLRVDFVEDHKIAFSIRFKNISNASLDTANYIASSLATAAWEMYRSWDEGDSSGDGRDRFIISSRAFEDACFESIRRYSELAVTHGLEITGQSAGDSEQLLTSFRPRKGTVVPDPTTVGDSKNSASSAVIGWPTFQGGARRQGVSASIGPASPSIRWGVGQNLSFHGSPVIGQKGTVFAVANDGNLYSVSPDGGLIKQCPLQPTGYWADPSLDAQGNIYAGFSELQRRDGFVLARAPDFTELWKTTVNGKVTQSPAISDEGKIYVSTTNGQLLALNSTGQLLWQRTVGERETSAPAIGPQGDIFVLSFSSGLHAITPDGALKWSFEIVGGASVPVIGENGVLYACANSELWAINPDGSYRWRYPFGGGGSPALAQDGTLYVASFNGNVYAVTPDGDTKWTFVGPGRNCTTSPVIDSNGTIYIGLHRYLYALSPDGAERWNVEFPGEPRSSPSISANGELYVACMFGGLFAISNVNAG